MTLLLTPSTRSARPSPLSTLSTPSSARAVPSTVSVVKCLDHEAMHFGLRGVYDDSRRNNNKRAIDYYNIGMRYFGRILCCDSNGVFLGAHTVTGFSEEGVVLVMAKAKGRLHL